MSDTGLASAEYVIDGTNVILQFPVNHQGDGQVRKEIKELLIYELHSQLTQASQRVINEDDGKNIRQSGEFFAT